MLPDLDILLAPTLAPLCVSRQDPRSVLSELARLEFRSIRLSAAQDGLRPRELDRSARRDLRARLRRLELELAGVDLLIPRKHYADSMHADRAAEALLAAVELAADLGPVPLTVDLPDDVPDDLVSTLRARADVTGTPIADLGAHGDRELGIAIDPAAIIASGGDPSRAASQADLLHDARLSDATRGLRVPPGEGDLDLLAYRMALATRGDVRMVTIDLRHLPEPWRVLDAARTAWNAALGSGGGRGDRGLTL